jgi:hypothetical protein
VVEQLRLAVVMGAEDDLLAGVVRPKLDQEIMPRAFARPGDGSPT